jgi:regulator of protease activity HflC (stomatin/prohibitin superfamily)
VQGLSEVLHKLLDYVGQLWPFTVIDPWETGVRVRLGKRMKVLTPGLHFVIPFVDATYTSETNTEVFTAGKQTIDGTTFEIVGAFRLVDVERYYRELNDDPVTAVSFAVQAAASDAMSNGAWKGATEAMLKAVLRSSRRRVSRWGFRLDWLEFRTVTDSPTLRLLTDAQAPTVVTAQGVLS